MKYFICITTLLTIVFSTLKSNAQDTLSDYNKKLELLQGMIGKPAPQFEATSIEGKKLSSESLKGKVVVVNFWFVGCAPCQEEMPLLNKLTAKYHNSDVIFISFSRTDKAGTEKFLSQTPFKYQTVADAKPIAQAFNVSGYPSHFVIDKEGVMRFASIASRDDIDIFLSDTIDKVLTKR